MSALPLLFTNPKICFLQKHDEMEGKKETYIVWRWDDFQHITSDCQRRSFLTVLVGHSESELDHTEVTTFITFAILYVSTAGIAIRQ
jgi:hypothetical protein